MSHNPRERRFERTNEKGQKVEVIEETLPGKKKQYGRMERKTHNHNTYVSGSTTLPGEKRYREIVKEQEKKKKDKNEEEVVIKKEKEKEKEEGNEIRLYNPNNPFKLFSNKINFIQNDEKNKPIKREEEYYYTEINVNEFKKTDDDYYNINFLLYNFKLI